MGGGKERKTPVVPVPLITVAYCIVLKAVPMKARAPTWQVSFLLPDVAPWIISTGYISAQITSELLACVCVYVITYMYRSRVSMALKRCLYLLFLQKLQNHWVEMKAKKRNNEITSTEKVVIPDEACSWLTYNFYCYRRKSKPKKNGITHI